MWSTPHATSTTWPGTVTWQKTHRGTRLRGGKCSLLDLIPDLVTMKTWCSSTYSESIYFVSCSPSLSVSDKQCWVLHLQILLKCLEGTCQVCETYIGNPCRGHTGWDLFNNLSQNLLDFKHRIYYQQHFVWITFICGLEWKDSAGEMSDFSHFNPHTLPHA